jgi:hypothetical protein
MADIPKNKQDFEAMLNAKAWKDPKFKKKLKDNPKEALKEMGLDVSKDVQIRIVEDDKNTVTFVIRSEPQNVAKMGEEELRKIAGGGACINSVCPIEKASHLG